jgi:hypothetical protein
MRGLTILGLAGVTLLATGCITHEDPMQAGLPVDQSMVRSADTEIVEAAIVREATIYPHQFDAHSAELNDLGRRVVIVLGRHLETHGGRVSVRRGGVDSDLYGARLGSVLDAFEAEGLNRNQIVLEDVMPGGDGATSTGTLLMLQDMYAPPSGATTTITNPES